MKRLKGSKVTSLPKDAAQESYRPNIEISESSWLLDPGAGVKRLKRSKVPSLPKDAGQTWRVGQDACSGRRAQACAQARASVRNDINDVK